jgi:hypothetical protein
MSDQNNKHCKPIADNGCGLLKPLSDFYCYGNRSDPRCKPCKIALQRLKRAEKKSTLPPKKKTNGFHKLTIKQQKKCVKMLKNGKTLYAVAKRIKRSCQTLYYWNRENMIYVNELA